MVVMALSTALTCSELFALKWLDIDLGETYTPGPTGDRGRRGRRCEDEVFTIRVTFGSSYRRDPIHVEARIAIRPGNGLGVCQPAQGWRTCTEVNRSTGEPHQASRDNRQTWRECGVAYLSAHLQLHARQLGVDMKVRQELLRHADVRTTIRVYTQAVSEQKRAAHSSVVESYERREENEQR